MEFTNTPSLTDVYSCSQLSSTSSENEDISEQHTFYLTTFSQSSTQSGKPSRLEPLTSPFKPAKRVSPFIIPRPKFLLKPTPSSHTHTKCPLVLVSKHNKKRLLPNDGKTRDSQEKEKFSKETKAENSLQQKDNMDLLASPSKLSNFFHAGDLLANKDTDKIRCITINGLRYALVNAFNRVKRKYTPITKKHPTCYRQITVTGSARMILSQNLIIGCSKGSFERRCYKQTARSPSSISIERRSRMQSGGSEFKIAKLNAKSLGSGANSESSFVSETSTCHRRHETPQGPQYSRFPKAVKGDMSCICEVNGTDIGIMICCDLCCSWLHISCLGISENRQPKPYVCPGCESKVQIHSKSPSWMSLSKKATFKSDPSIVNSHSNEMNAIHHDPLCSSQLDLVTDPFDSDGELPLFEKMAQQALSSADQPQSMLFENEDDIYMLFSDIPPFDGADTFSSDINCLASEPYLACDDTYQQLVSRSPIVDSRIYNNFAIHSPCTMATQLMSDPFSDVLQLSDTFGTYPVYETLASTSDVSSLPALHNEDQQSLYDFNSKDYLSAFTDSHVDISMISTIPSDNFEWVTEPPKIE